MTDSYDLEKLEAMADEELIILCYDKLPEKYGNMAWGDSRPYLLSVLTENDVAQDKIKKANDLRGDKMSDASTGSDPKEPGWLTRLRPAAKQRRRTQMVKIRWHDLQELLRERDILWHSASKETKSTMMEAKIQFLLSLKQSCCYLQLLEQPLLTHCIIHGKRQNINSMMNVIRIHIDSSTKKNASLPALFAVHQQTITKTVLPQLAVEQVSEK